ncbi:MAG: nucleoside hydrolase [Proteobacteria bacterium]|nr:nucleoside hydrolase [Pseudomonadota bacterium]
MKKIILDVDTGIDDAIAIMLGLSDPNLNLIGITAVTGNVNADKAFINSSRVVNYFGFEHELPVLRGATENLIERDVRAFHVHGEDGLNGMLEGRDYQSRDEFAVLWIIDQVKNHPHEITFVGTAPITNLALAIKLAPEIVPLLNQVILMTGAFEVPGNVTPIAEFNAYGDPIALQIVLDAGIKDLRLIGLDVTTKTLLSLVAIQSIQNQRVSEFILNLTSNYRQFYLDTYRMNGCAMHDPLALGLASDDSFCGFEESYVTMELKGEHTYGKTVMDRHGIHGKKPNALVATSVDATRFIAYLIDQLKTLEVTNG